MKLEYDDVILCAVPKAIFLYRSQSVIATIVHFLAALFEVVQGDLPSYSHERSEALTPIRWNFKAILRRPVCEEYWCLPSTVLHSVSEEVSTPVPPCCSCSAYMNERTYRFWCPALLPDMPVFCGIEMGRDAATPNLIQP